MHFNTIKINDTIKKWAKELNRHFSKKGIHMDNKYMKRCPTSLTIRDMQIKTTMRDHLTPVRMAAIWKSTNNKCWRWYGEKGTFLHCLCKCKLVQPLWRTVWTFLFFFSFFFFCILSGLSQHLLPQAPWHWGILNGHEPKQVSRGEHWGRCWENRVEAHGEMQRWQIWALIQLYKEGDSTGP